MATYSDAEKAQIVQLADSGESWEAIGRALNRSATAVETAARRMRERGEWPFSDDAVRLPPDGPGRPRNRKPTTSVSVRVSPVVEAALRDVAADAGYGRRVGRVLTEAVERALARAQKRKPAPLTFDQFVTPCKLANTAKTNTVSVCVDANAFDALTACYPEQAPMSVLYAAIEQLLHDIGYVFVDA